MRKLIYAPNVHVGGGFVLLKSLIQSLDQSERIILWLDKRAINTFDISPFWTVNWVEPSFKGRFSAEYSLSKFSKKDDIVLCFHGLPPLFKLDSTIHLFQQNRILFRNTDLSRFKMRTRLRIRVEQFLSFYLRKRISTFWVQTPSMMRELTQWYKSSSVHVRVFPFLFDSLISNNLTQQPEYDFIYVADGEAHKNHIVLIDAWVILSKQGYKPSLVLTLSDRDAELKRYINDKAKTFGLNIFDVGVMPHHQVLHFYSKSKALIFPSRSESFGLPLIEASNLSLPILAGELDFVRDVCLPQETFDPNSAVSIARSVNRFLKNTDKPVEIYTASDFVQAVFKD